MSDHSKHDMHEQRGVGRRIGDALARSMPSDPDDITRKSWIERRLQTWLLSITSSLLATLIAAIIFVFARVPGRLDQIDANVEDMRIQNAGNARSDEMRAKFEALDRRIDLRDARDAAHDSAIDSLSHRIDRVEYVIEVAPATARYARTRSAAGSTTP